MAETPDQILKDCLARADRLKADRGTKESTWQRIRDVVFPSGQGITSRDTPGQRNPDILDNTGEQAAELLSAALFAGVTHPEQPWFTLGAVGLEPGQDRDADIWFDHASRATLARFASPVGGFASQQDEKLQELVTYGTGVMFIGEQPGGQPIFQTRPIGECLLAENEEGRVDTNYRLFQRTAKQAFDKWGAACGEKTAEKAQKPKVCDDLVNFVHAVYPRRARDEGRADAANMAWASVWINQDEKHLMRVDGFPEFPYACPRWRKRSGEIYGRGAGDKALADILMLQRAMSAQIRGVEKIIDPSLMVADDGVLSPVRLGSGKLTHVRADMLMGQGSPIKPILTGGRPDVGDVFMQDIRTRIEAAFYTNLIQFARDPKMTATQFLGITEQTATVLAPILSRLRTEDAQPMVERMVAIGFRNNWYRPLPPSLQGRVMKIEYTSPMTKRQNIGEARAYTQWIEIATPVAAAGHPEVFDNVDHDAASRDLGEILGMRSAWIRGMDQVAEIRNARLQAQEETAGAERAEQLAGAAQKGAQALSVIQGGRADGA